MNREEAIWEFDYWMMKNMTLAVAYFDKCDLRLHRKYYERAKAIAQLANTMDLFTQRETTEILLCLENSALNDY